MNNVTTLLLNALPVTYCFKCLDNTLNVTLVHKNNIYMTCPFSGCTDTEQLIVDGDDMCYCNTCKILFEKSHAHNINDQKSDVYYVKIITNYTYNNIQCTGCPILTTIDDIDDIVINTKSCLCKNGGICSDTEISTHADFLSGTCPDTV